MWNGVFALLERSLRTDARTLASHLTRGGLLLGIYFALCFVLATERFFGAPGMRFFVGLAYLDVAFATLLGIGYFSSVITEEKEEGTLGLLLMSGISPLGILVGKTTCRLWQAALLVAAQYPCLLLAVTMGGVSPVQVSALLTALIAYLIFLTGLGLLCSTLAPRSRQASAAMVILLVIYAGIPRLMDLLVWIVGTGASATATSDAFPLKTLIWLVQSIRESCLIWQIGHIMTTGFGESPWSIQVVSNLVLGVALAGMSWPFFFVSARQLQTDGSSRGALSRQRRLFRFHAGRPRWNPFFWKDFHFVSGGFASQLIRLLIYAPIALFGVIFEELRPDSRVMEPCLILLSTILSIDTAMVLARSVQDEIRGQTIASLCMLPISTVGMIYAKFAGALAGCLVGAVIELVATLATNEGRSDFHSILFQQPLIGMAVVMLFVLPPHFAMAVGTFLKWGAVPVAIGLTFAVYFAILGITRSMIGFREEYFGVIGLMMIGICVACHFFVLLRIPVLAARS